MKRLVSVKNKFLTSLTALAVVLSTQAVVGAEEAAGAAGEASWCSWRSELVQLELEQQREVPRQRQQ